MTCFFTTTSTARSTEQAAPGTGVCSGDLPYSQCSSQASPARSDSGDLHLSTAIGDDDYASSVLACKAIFTPDPPTTVTTPTPKEVRVAQEHDLALQ